ncbi:MAG: flagellar basal body-associated FliL family protein [Desulfobulbaceae bacterium]|nr:flagellar basal body-associated FliL family protein [Desulfobulbaceae bacterium]
MVDEPEVQEGEEAAPKKKSKALFFIILSLSVILLGGGSFFAYIKLMGTQPNAENSALNSDPAPPADTVGEIFALEPFVVNLADPKGKRYLKVQIKLEIESVEALERTQKAAPKLRDLVIIMLTSLTFEEVMTPEGKIRIRDELLERFNQVMRPDRVKNIYFTEFVVQ